MANEAVAPNLICHFFENLDVDGLATGPLDVDSLHSLATGTLDVDGLHSLATGPCAGFSSRTGKAPFK